MGLFHVSLRLTFHHALVDDDIAHLRTADRMRYADPPDNQAPRRFVEGGERNCGIVDSEQRTRSMAKRRLSGGGNLPLNRKK